MKQIGIIGAGPAGLMAAEVLALAGNAVTLFDHMASPARKFLLAGRGGLNLTHSETRSHFILRYGKAADWLEPMIDGFSPEDLKNWSEGLGQQVFVGSSGRVFPRAFKAAPLLRAWLRRLDGLGVRFAGRYRWLGFESGCRMRFVTSAGEEFRHADAVLLALGGASWPRLGSDGSWVHILRTHGIAVNDLRPANCGLTILWSQTFAERFEGVALKRVQIEAAGRSSRGDAVITRTGLEGGAVYPLSAALRDRLEKSASCESISVDLRPELSEAELDRRLAGPRQGRSLGNFLRVRGGLSQAAIGLVQEAIRSGSAQEKLCRLVKALPLTVIGVQPIDRAISSAGGIRREELDGGLMLKKLPGVFAAGEMLDWEAPTGGYLLQACFSSGAWAAKGIQSWLEARDMDRSGGVRATANFS
jgi:uncharacterized flavoprotein (TIGR03862 family)